MTIKINRSNLKIKNTFYDNKNNFILLADKMIENTTKGSIIQGIVRGNTISKNEIVYLLGPRSNVIKTEVLEITNLDNEIIEKAFVDQRVNIKLKNLHSSKIYRGDILTNKIENIDEDNLNTLKNIRLNALLEEMNRVHDHSLINLVFDDIIMSSHFLTPVQIVNDTEAQNNFYIIENNKIIYFLPLKTNSNKYFLSVFTNFEELYKNDVYNAQDFKLINFNTLSKIILDNNSLDGFILNPFSHKVQLTKETIINLTNQKNTLNSKLSDKNLNLEEEYTIEDLKDYPIDMIFEIKNYMKNNKNINKSWIRILKTKKEKSYLLVLDVEDDYNNICRDLSKIVTTYLTDLPLDMIYYDSNFKENSFEKSAVKNSKPFYQKTILERN